MALNDGAISGYKGRSNVDHQCHGDDFRDIFFLLDMKTVRRISVLKEPSDCVKSRNKDLQIR